MENKIIRYGVVGVGRGGYVASLGLDNPNCKLVAACDVNEPKLMRYKASLEKKGLPDCQYFTDFDEMLKTDIDAVVVATDAIYHVPFVKKAMEAGKAQVPVPELPRKSYTNFIR